MAFEQVAGPQGFERDDTHAAIIASTLANMFVGKGKRMSVDDFMPRWEKPPDPQKRMESQVAMLRRATAPKRQPDPERGAS